MDIKKKKTHEKVELEIDAIGFNGIAIARREGIVYFVKGGVPGDKVIAELRRKKKKHREAEVIEILEPSKDRVEPLCKYFGTCGGCSWQNLSYEEQIIWKKRHLQDAFQRIGKITPEEILDTLPSPKIYNYRNKMDFSFGASRWLTKDEIQDTESIEQKHFALGLHIPGRYDKILDMDSCQIQSEDSNEILVTIRTKALELGVTAYNDRTHEGFLRNLVLRTGNLNNELMCILVSNKPCLPEEENFLSWYRTEFARQFPKAVSIVHAINAEITPVAYGEISFIEGKSFISEQILGIEYKISPFSFFQTNPFQLDIFISKVLEFAELKETDTVWDLYCGTGSITLPASKQARKIYGFELVESSIEDAKANAKLNNIENVHFETIDLHSKDVWEILNRREKADTMIIDPPRAGMHKNLVKFITDSAPQRIVYVSCNPTTQARDCELLSEIYNIKKVQPVDMFPHTYHIESVALLEKKTGA